MRKFLFIPIFFLMVNLVAAEDLEITEVKQVINIMIEVQSWLDLQTITDDQDQQQQIVDFISLEILEKGYNISADDHGVFLIADPQTLKPTKITIWWAMVFDDYYHSFNITTCKKECTQ